MSLTITFDDDVSERLESEANQRRIAVEELAASILDRAVSRGQVT